MNVLQPPIRDLAITGDRRTLALVSREGAIVWYCPGRFDHPALFAGLLDAEKGGAWTLEVPDVTFKERDHLEEIGSGQEGALLAGTIWMAQYWIMRNDLERTRRILDAALSYASDPGFFAEEADPQTGDMLCNLPQTFVHAAFIGAVVDYRNAISNNQGN